MAMPGVDEQDYQRGTVHRTGGQFYDLYPAYVGPGRLVLYWYPVYADERQRQTNQSAPCRAIRRPLMRARRCELKSRAGRRTVRGARRGAYPKMPRQNNAQVSLLLRIKVVFQMLLGSPYPTLWPSTLYGIFKWSSLSQV